jgi:hypothetical protein
MSSELPASSSPGPPDGADQTSRAVSFWLGSAAVYVASLLLYAPSLRYGPLSLDDRGQLQELRSAAIPR